MRVLTALIVLTSIGVAGAQSLGDVARQEAERRKGVKTPGKTYTNGELKSDPRDVASLPPSSTAQPPPSTTPATGTPAPGAAAGKTGDADAKPTPALDEKGWRAKVQSERDALSRAQIFAEALQSRINGLSADFTARDDPAQRASVGAERQKALDELTRVKSEIQQHTKALSDIQDEGRKASVPAGWLR